MLFAVVLLLLLLVRVMMMTVKLTFTQALWAVNDLNDWWVILRSHSLTVPSSLPVARQALPGSRAKPHTSRPTWSFEPSAMGRASLALMSYMHT